MLIMAGYNRIIMIGNLTRDPEYKTLPSGQAVCRLTIASNRQFKNRQSGEMVQEVCYVDVDVWGAQAESCRQYLAKGRPVLIEGRLKLDSWQDQNGQNRSKHSIFADRVVFLGSNAQADMGLSAQESQGIEESSVPTSQAAPQSELEKELFDQIDQIKKRQPKSPSVKQTKPENTAVSTGEINFKDQPPFQDDLPF
jgi:single-strand DNA-binding protein